MPLSVSNSVDHPISLYAATKKANVFMAHSYKHQYQLPKTGLRFYTVYGPQGRPDLSPIIFATAIKENMPIKVLNHGEMMCDYTYINVILEDVCKVLFYPARPNQEWDVLHPDTASSKAPFCIYNIGNSKPIGFMYFVETIEKTMSIKAIKEFIPLQPVDVLKIYNDVSQLELNFDFHPNTSIESGILSFVE